MIKNVKFGVLFLKILFWAYSFIWQSITRSLFIFKKPGKITNDFFNNYIFIHTFQWTSSEFFFNFRFSSREPQGQQKLTKKATHFAIELRSRHLNSLNIEKYMLPQHSQKHLSLYEFSSKNLVGVGKNICIAPFLDAQELHSRSTLKANVCIFLYIFVKDFLSQRCSKLSSGGEFGRLNNFLKGARCLDLVKRFTIFHFKWNFWKFNYFSAFRYFHQ